MGADSILFMVLGGLFIISAFFAAAEAALIALNKVRLRHYMEQKRRGAKRLYNIVAHMDKFIATILVGNNLVNTAIAIASDPARMATAFKAACEAGRAAYEIGLTEATSEATATSPLTTFLYQ